MMTTEGFDVVQQLRQCPLDPREFTTNARFCYDSRKIFFIKLNTFSLSLMIGEAYNDVGNIKTLLCNDLRDISIFKIAKTYLKPSHHNHSQV